MYMYIWLVIKIVSDESNSVTTSNRENLMHALHRCKMQPINWILLELDQSNVALYLANSPPVNGEGKQTTRLPNISLERGVSTCDLK